MTTNRIGKGWLAWLAGSMVLAGMAVAISTEDAPAQTKTKTDAKAKTKTDTKAKTDDKSEKKDAKADPAPTNFPPRIDTVDAGRGGTVQVATIDESISKGWKSNNTFPSERCTDYEFIRRATLDIVGRIPTVEEIAAYLKHSEKTRRAWLVNALLDGKEYGYGAEYAQNFANLWSVHLMTRTGSGKHFQAQMNDWLYNQLKGDDKNPNADWSKVAHELIAGAGDSNRNGAVNYLLHNLGEEIKQDDKNGRWNMVPATSRTTRLFLGVRTQCVQCHDHPFNQEWGQHHFWGINAFFRQIETKGTQGNMRPLMMAGKNKKKVVGQEEFNLKDNVSFNPSGLISFERRNSLVLFTDASFLDGKKMPKKDSSGKAFTGTRREALAGMITTSPWFAKAFVNRTWNHFFGKSFTRDNPDDFGEHNPVSHPELLDTLAEEWAKQYKHNPKELIRWICNSQAYGLSSRANRYNDKTEDETLFARMLLKPMTPEQMFESMMVATQAKLGTNKDDKLAAKEAWFSKLVVNFGNDEGEEGSYTGTVIQALLLMNGQDINTAITDPKDGAVAAMVKRHGGASQAKLPQAVNEMFMHVLSRPATKQEIMDIGSGRMYNFRAGSKTTPNTPAFWSNYYQDIMWALLNSNEFVLNH